MKIDFKCFSWYKHYKMIYKYQRSQAVTPRYTTRKFINTGTNLEFAENNHMSGVEDEDKAKVGSIRMGSIRSI